MEHIEFEWDPAKSISNHRKHGVTFREACTAFSDECARIIPDPDHSDHEQRFILLGCSTMPRILVVVHCLRNRERVIRIISARRASAREREQYGRLSKNEPRSD